MVSVNRTLDAVIASARISRFNRQRGFSAVRDRMGAELAMIDGSQLLSMKIEKIGDLAVG